MEANGAATKAAEGIVEVETLQTQKITFISKEAREAYIKSLPKSKDLKVRRFFFTRYSGGQRHKIFCAYVREIKVQVCSN